MSAHRRQIQKINNSTETKKSRSGEERTWDHRNDCAIENTDKKLRMNARNKAAVCKAPSMNSPWRQRGDRKDGQPEGKVHGVGEEKGEAVPNHNPSKQRSRAEALAIMSSTCALTMESARRAGGGRERTVAAPVKGMGRLKHINVQEGCITRYESIC